MRASQDENISGIAPGKNSLILKSLLTNNSRGDRSLTLNLTPFTFIFLSTTLAIALETITIFS
ncbi:hypothetical protein [Okeania sp. KiyG1]|uniref:hypothetical protein n=1 Tax=Okeania sp. KiyG1 TaxID=2720165 RepID=UPI0019220714|nr:hypothetical protein [Okeania sp. KiyG1]